ncbi:MAG TPA: nuclear transport factor 2 family protein [Solirubrobacteraceae bacterium]|nr:nuclear transport factor 2 family protein [Solirubrobacteraceae bacterium]
MSEANVERARSGFAAALRGDFEALEELLDPHVRWHGGDPEADGACHDRGEALTFMRRALGNGWRGELVDVLDAGERVVVLLRPADDPEAVRANLTTFRDGKVVEMVAYPEPRDAMAAAGL